MLERVGESSGIDGLYFGGPFSHGACFVPLQAADHLCFFDIFFRQAELNGFAQNVIVVELSSKELLLTRRG